MIKTDLEYIRTPRGFPVELSTTIPGLLLSDYVGIDSIATGANLGYQLSKWMFLYRDYSVEWNNIFKAVDIPLNQVTSGISEVGTMKIILDSPYHSFIHWCMNEKDSTPCLRCYKCFRKKLLELILSKRDISDDMLDNFFISSEVRTMIRELPMGVESVIAYITSHYDGNHKIMKSLKKRTRGDILDTSWMEKWYEPSKASIVDKYYKHVKNQIVKYLETMNEVDVINMQNWNINEVVQSPVYQKYQQELIADLIEFKQNYKLRIGR